MGAYFIPEKLSDLSDDATHRTVTDTEKTAWNYGSGVWFGSQAERDALDPTLIFTTRDAWIAGGKIGYFVFGIIGGTTGGANFIMPNVSSTPLIIAPSIFTVSNQTFAMPNVSATPTIIAPIIATNAPGVVSTSFSMSSVSSIPSITAPVISVISNTAFIIPCVSSTPTIVAPVISVISNATFTVPNTSTSPSITAPIISVSSNQTFVMPHVSTTPVIVPPNNILFDEFTGTTLNSVLWDTVVQTVSVSGGLVYVGPSGANVNSQIEATRGKKFNKESCTITAKNLTNSAWGANSGISGIYMLTWDGSSNLKDTIYIGTLGTSALKVRNGAYTSSSLGTLALNTPATIKVQFDNSGANLIVFLNGTSVGTFPFSSVAPNNATATKMTFGVISSASSTVTNGALTLDSYRVQEGLV